MSLAILCSGQGPQHPGMFALTGDAPEASLLFDHAATLLDGRDPRAMVISETAAALHENRVGQILCTLQALAAASVLRPAWPRQILVAGYSVGEVAAWGVGGFIGATVALDLVARRAEVMDAASVAGDGLLFLRGLPREAVDEICARHQAAVAIVNPQDAYVVGGTGAALDAVAEDAHRLGAVRIVRVGVNVASHTSRLAAAAVKFRQVLEETPIAHPPTMGVRVFSGIDGSAVLNLPTGIDKLAAQISHTIHWADCLEASVEAGATAFLELGPGRALSAMAASTYPDIPSRSLEDFKKLEGVTAWLTRLYPTR